VCGQLRQRPLTEAHSCKLRASLTLYQDDRATVPTP
jgi:hypothetical protein